MAQNLIKLIDSFIDQSKDTQDHLFSLCDIYDIDKANGYWLDRLNDLIGGTIRKPNTYSDTNLRSRMKAKVSINRDAGTISALLDAVRYYLLLNDINSWSEVKDITIPYIIRNGNVYISVTSSNINRSKIGEIISFAPAGVGVYLELVPEFPFGFTDDSDPNTRGFNEGSLVERFTL
jgi:hypothetical protein